MRLGQASETGSRDTVAKPRICLPNKVSGLSTLARGYGGPVGGAIVPPFSPREAISIHGNMKEFDISGFTF